MTTVSGNNTPGSYPTAASASSPYPAAARAPPFDNNPSAAAPPSYFDVIDNEDQYQAKDPAVSITLILILLCLLLYRVVEKKCNLILPPELPGVASRTTWGSVTPSNYGLTPCRTHGWDNVSRTNTIDTIEIDTIIISKIHPSDSFRVVG
jgi:hypothetical protein